MHFLSDIGFHALNEVMTQLWFSAETIGFTNPQEIDDQNGYVAILKYSHVRISEDDDVFFWTL